MVGKIRPMNSPDWEEAVKTALQSGPRRAVVFTFAEHGALEDWTPYSYLSTRDTSGIEQGTDKAAPRTIENFYTMLRGVGNGEMVNDNIDRFLIGDLAKRYIADQSYEALVISQTRSIIRYDVAAISLNPVFRTLSRAVSNDRQNEARSRMKIWLESVYDSAAGIPETINTVPSVEQIPAVYLDPTMGFVRSESCEQRALQRPGKVLTQLRYVAKRKDLPGHIKTADTDLVPRTPLALVLALQKHDRQFRELLFRAVLPGTKISNCHATVLTALIRS
ncbi:dihydroxyacid dehydratase [Paramyrothecium foliicola]|nr:dihydroxyacid dehydratase [Paramyrothecium foliicola]